MACIEAVDQLGLEREPNPQLYRMVVGVLRTIAERPAPLNVPAFYWKLLRNEGLEPHLDGCVRCGEAEPDAELVAFDIDEGGVLCRACRTGSAISPGALSIMRDILGGRLNQALALEESPLTHEVGTLATRALEHHIERRLKAVAMFERH
jgi:DNA repair protein RecO (recombination protein O)